MAIEIVLTRGYVALVDDEDADLAQYGWHVMPVSKRHSTYAVHKNRLMHRVILERILGRPLTSSEFCDHVDNNGLNNCRGNLRLATNSQNQHNARRRSDNKSGYKGVSFNNATGRWQATITLNMRLKNLGNFDTPEEAHRAYCDAAREHYGEFARFE